MSSFFREMAFCTYDTIESRHRIIRPFLYINLFSLFTLNGIFYVTKNNTFIFESILVLVSILLSEILIKKVRINPILSLPAFLIVAYSFINLTNPSKMNFFVQDSWLMLQIIALVFVNFLGSTRCNLMLGVLILASPLIAHVAGLDPFDVWMKQFVLYFLFPITLYLSYIKTRLSIEKIENINKMNQLQLQNYKQEKKIIEEQNVYELGRMSSVIAHEINNPVTVISLYISKLIKNDSIDDKTKDGLKKIDKYTNRIAQIVALIKKKSFITLEKEYFDISRLVKDEVELYQIVLSKRDIELQMDIDCSCKVYANEREISQVIGNLISNSAQALDSSKKEIDKNIKLSIKSFENKCELTVLDNADGIKEEYLSKIFEEKFTTKKKGDGLGLGLSLVKKIVQSNNAQIECKSNENGTCFKITFEI